jgi:hypothetical protein
VEAVVAGARFLLTQGPVLRREGEPARNGRVPESLDGLEATWTGWLLLGGNNRELGRGCVPFSDVAECESALDLLVGQAETLRTMITADLDVSSWRWRAEDQDGPVAVGGRLYQRRRECAYAVNQFMAALPTAELPVAAPRVLALSWAEWSRPGEGSRGRSAGGSTPDLADPSGLRRAAR